MCYFADTQWWEWQTEGKAKPVLGLSAAQVRERFSAFAGQKCSIHTSGCSIEDAAVHILRNKHFPNNGVGLSLDPEALVTGSNSGCQATNIALLAKPRLVLLLGMDGDYDTGVGGKRHWHGDHPVVEPDGIYPVIRQSFKALAYAAKGCETRIINCSPGTKIDAFERMSLDKALCL